jgi:hypothetical protein
MVADSERHPASGPADPSPDQTSLIGPQLIPPPPKTSVLSALPIPHSSSHHHKADSILVNALIRPDGNTVELANPTKLRSER